MRRCHLIGSCHDWPVAEIHSYMARGWWWGCSHCDFTATVPAESSSLEGARHQLQSTALAHMNEMHPAVPPMMPLVRADLFEPTPYRYPAYYID